MIGMVYSSFGFFESVVFFLDKSFVMNQEYFGNQYVEMVVMVLMIVFFEFVCGDYEWFGVVVLQVLEVGEVVYGENYVDVVNVFQFLGMV